MAAFVARSTTERSPGGMSGGGWRTFLGLTVPGFAWEFLRRNPAYRADYASLVGDPDPRWGLRFSADPQLSAAQADIYWRADIAPGLVLPMAKGQGECVPKLPVPIVQAPQRAAPEGLHVRLRSGLQLMLHGQTKVDGPIAVLLAYDAEFGLRVRAVQALERAANGRGEPKSRLTQAQRTRLAQSLAALDGAQNAASYRDIARCLFGDEAADQADFRTSTIRDVTIRLVRTGRALMQGGYLGLLRAGL